MNEKNKTTAEKKFDEKEKKSPDEKKSLPENDLLKQLGAAAEGLFYTSETDAPFEAFVWRQDDKNPGAFERAEVLQFAGEKPDAKIEEKTLEDFFARPTTVADWFGDEEKAQVEKFIKLKETLADNLKNVKVFRVGETEINIYIVGVDAEGNMAGVKTKAVET